MVVIGFVPLATMAPTAQATSPICAAGSQQELFKWTLSQVPLVSVGVLLPRDCLPISPPDVWLGAPANVAVGDQFTIEAGSASLASWTLPNSNAQLHVIDGCTSGVKTCTLRADSPTVSAVNGQFVVGVHYQDPGQQPVYEVTDIATRTTDLWQSYVVLRNANLAWRQSHRLRAVKTLDPAGSPSCQYPPQFTTDANGTAGDKWKQYIAQQSCWLFGDFTDASYQSSIAAVTFAGLPLGAWWIEAVPLDNLTGPADPGFAPQHLVVAGQLADNIDATLGAQPPHAEFSAAAEEAGSAKWNFDASASTASDPATISSYDWDFGDPDHTTATGVTASNIYAGSGTYTVSLTVTDSMNLQTTVTQDIEVTSALVVNSTGDTPNSSDTSTGCNTGGLVDGKPECTLRAAIMAANAAAKAQTISFAIPGLGMPTIAVASSLPALRASVRVDGTTQPGGWVGLSAPDVTAMTGLVARAADVTITGMVTSGFWTPMASLAANTTITHNRIGVDSTGSTVTTAPQFGISIFEAASANVTDNVITATSVGINASTTAAAVTITGNRIGTNGGNGAALSTVPDVGIRVSGGLMLADSNVVASKIVGVLVSSPTAGSKVTRNHVGVNALGNGFTSSEVAIMVNGSPGVLVEANHAVSTRAPWGDIVVTGSNQVDTEVHQPSDALNGPVTGGGVTVRGNLLGMLADGSPIGVGSVGVLVYGRANDVTIIDNDIGGHAGQALVWADNSSDITVKQNRIGLTPGQTSISGGARSGVKFGGVTGGTIDGNIIVGSVDAGVEITTDTAPGSYRDSSSITIARNLIGLAADGSTVLANRVGVHAVGATIVIGPGNVISGNTEEGIAAESNGAGMQIAGNAIGLDSTLRLARPNATGIAVDGLEVEIVSNRIAANTIAGLRVKSSTYATIYDNDIGFGVGGQALGNGTGVSVENGNGLMLNNDIRNSAGAGVAVASTARMMILSNSTWDNAGKGIDGEGVPAAPTLAVVQAKVRGLDRRWFVLTDAPSAVGIIHIYGNDSCTAPNDDEGRHPIDTIINGSHGTSMVLSPKDRHGLQYDFYTVTFTVQEAGTADKPIGRTSEFSTCVAPNVYPDTSGTGIPDVIQTALGGDPANPHKVIFPSDDGRTVTLAAPVGRLVNVGPSDAPDMPAGMTLPAGQFAFELTGITPGDPALVAVSTSVATATWYYRYGPPARGRAAQWYSWDYDSSSGLGGQRISPTEWVLHFIDGAAGDDDGSANGTIVDPGGPGIGPQIVPEADPLPTATVAPTTTVTLTPTPMPPPAFTELPATGSNQSTPELSLALMCVGVGLLLSTRRRSKAGRRHRMLPGR